MNTHYHELSFCHPNLLQIMGIGMGESVLEYSSGSTPKHRSSELFEDSERWCAFPKSRRRPIVLTQPMLGSINQTSSDSMILYCIGLNIKHYNVYSFMF